jgi:dinuclear metal center YbgI/SA1388 family protein
MRVEEIFNILNDLSAFELQEKWDNSGLQVGSMLDEVQSVVVALDVDEQLLDSLDENTLLITHHPLIFSGLKAVDFATYPSNLISKMMHKNISNIAMHTNFDITHLNDYVVEEILGYKIVQKDGFIAYIELDEEFEVFLEKVKSTLGLEYTKYVQTKSRVRRVAITTGSGCSLIPTINADCFLTGDIKYHDAMHAKSIKLSLIDIGHYESEHFFTQILQKTLKNLGLEVIIAASENPFRYK